MNDNTWLTIREPVWLLKNSIFLKAIIQTISADSAICTLEDGSLVQVKKSLIFQRNPAYKQFVKQRWDLMDTDVLNEPEILKTLKFRLENSRIYTYVENSLLSVNPYIPIKALYSEQLKQFYGESIIANQQSFRDLQPHLYAITAHALSQLKYRKTDQAVIISGESGSGKTEANKECLRFLQYYFHQQKSTIDKEIDNILNLSTPILEAFGNSKTIRNNNSSRFGKYLNISLDQNLQIKRARIYNYLLQKSRLISRNDNQQNFHIFYELLKGLNKTQKHQYYLQASHGKQYKLEDLNYLKTSSKQPKYEQHPQISFQKVKESLCALGDQTAYDFVCRILSAILLLGNLIPFESQNQDCCRIQNQQIFGHISQLLKIKKQTLLGALTCYPIRIGSQILTKYFNGREVQQLIHSLSKILYQKLFQWIINEINAISHYSGNDQLINLGFLDIYGFQILQSNSLQQLFINYTNQRLHQIYLAKIFKEEQLLFQRQGLINRFMNIPFLDNVGVLQLIDYQQLSVMNSLDEWCTVASPDDSSFITKLRHKHKKHPNFPSSNFNLPSNMFLIRHSPKDIQYSVIGFREKNKDLVREQIKTAMRSSTIANLANLFEQNTDLHESVVKNNHKIRKFLSSKFRYEINTLIVQLLGKCDLHFIRCIKSNNFKQPLLMEDEVAYNQICYLGILDTIKLKKIGYCMKLDYQTIDRRFKWLVRYYFNEKAFPKQIMKSLKDFLSRFQEDQMLFGKTMVFFKDYVYSALVKKYTSYFASINQKASKIQKKWYIYKLHRKIIKMRKFKKTIANYLKGAMANDCHKVLMTGLRKIQAVIRLKLAILKEKRKQHNLNILQIYIKKQICRAQRMKVAKSIQIIINFMRKNLMRKTIKKMLVISKLRNYIIDRSWMKIVMSRKYKIQTYILGFLTQIGSKNQIMAANNNTHNKFKQKYVTVIEGYVHGFKQSNQFQKLLSTIKYTQRFFRTWIYRQKFLKLRQAAIVIQRAYRQYYFNKNTARQIFDINFGQYKKQLQNQNTSIRKFLYDNPMSDSLKILYKNYLGKFKQKCSLFYFMVDFQSFIHLDHCYPENSWLLNYFQIVKESFDRDNPIQTVSIGETFTVTATTNKVYIWGMNEEFNTLEKAVTVKAQNQSRIQKVRIQNKNIQIYYEGGLKEGIKNFSTINRDFNLQNGKLYENRDMTLKIFKLLAVNERVAELSCGSSHVILRSTNKKVYTFGNGKSGQLGHDNYYAVQNPKIVDFQQFKNHSPVQVTASFSSSLVLLSNKKMYWFGTNGTIDKVKVPLLFDLTRKFQQYNNGDFAPIRINGCWSRSMSIIGVTLIHFNGKLSSNIGLRNKIYDLIACKWQQADIQKINPPFNTSFSDYLEQCHVKLPKNKIVIEPQSKRILKKMQEKVNSFQNCKNTDISFSDSNFQ